MGMYPQHQRQCEIGNFKIKYWNTGRLYSEDGQKIIAININDENGDRVLFFDLTRNIEGRISDPFDFRRYQIMTVYDRTEYTYLAEADYIIKRELFENQSELESLFV